MARSSDNAGQAKHPRRRAAPRRRRPATNGRPGAAAANPPAAERASPQNNATHGDAELMVGDLLRRLLALQRAAGRTPMAAEAEVAADAVEELQTALEEIRVAEEELRVAREQAEAERQRYEDLFQFAPDGYLVSSPKGVLLEANRSAAQLLGIEARALVNKPLVAYVHPDDRTAYWLALQSMERDDRGEWMLRINPRRKPMVITQVTAAAVRDEMGRLTAVRWMVRDVTRQKQAEAALAASRRELSVMSSELLLAEERERRRIATDIHDHIGQALAVMQMRLGALRAACPKAVHGQFDDLRGLLGQSLAQTRTLSFELSPPVLYELGLEAALQWLTEQKSREAGARGGPAGEGPKVEFRDDGRDKPLAQPVQILIFQAVRELLANVFRHSKAHWARASIWRDGADVVVTVEDDGGGFDPEVINPSHGRTSGFGLFSVRERLSHVDGKLLLDNRVGGGAKVTLVVPLRATSPPTPTRTAD